MRTFIKNGLLYDGSGAAPDYKNIVIEDQLIQEITASGTVSADQVIDAKGLVVTPGFIDLHRHCDVAVLTQPEFGTIEMTQGLTSVIGGNCGLAPTPAWPKYQKELFDFVEPCLGEVPNQTCFAHFTDYLEALSVFPKAVSMGSYLALGALKAAIKGYGKSVFTKTEMTQATTYIKAAMEAGAVGLSMGLMYQPECYSRQDELIELLSAASDYNRPVSCHIRGEGNTLVPSVAEVIALGAAAELPIHITHFKATGSNNWGSSIWQAIDLIERARAQGQDVTVDFYPYCGGSTMLASLLPPTVLEESQQLTIEGLAGAAGRQKLAHELAQEIPGWDNMVTAIGWERILISSVKSEKNRHLCGRTFAAAAALAGYERVSDFMCQLLVEEAGKVSVIVLSMSQQDVDTIAKLPYSVVISDALYGNSEMPHPRLYGSFPRIIREYVRERQVLTLPQAVQKMTSLPAKRLALNDRGWLKAGYRADLNLFCPEKIRDFADYQNPCQCCTGFEQVIIGGQTALLKDQVVKRNCGEIIRH